MLLVEHGKRCARCAKNGKPRKEAHGPCPLVNLATTAGKGGRLSAKAAAEDAGRAIKEDPEALELRPEDLKQDEGAKDVKVKDVKGQAIKEDPEALDLRPEDLKQEEGAEDVKAKVKDVKVKGVKGRREVQRRIKQEVEDAAVKLETA